MKAPPILTRILAVMAVSLWGVIGYKVYVAAHGEGNDHPETDVGESISLHEPYTYKADVRDPFQSIPLPDSANAKRRTAQLAWTPPPLKMTGIVGEKGLQTAILEGANGEVSFAHEGETVSGVRIIRIRSGHVVYEYMKVKKEWVLSGDE